MMALAAEKPAIAIATDSRMSEIAEASRLPYINDNVSLQFEQTNMSLKSPLNMVWYHFPHPGTTPRHRMAPDNLPGGDSS